MRNVFFIFSAFFVSHAALAVSSDAWIGGGKTVAPDDARFTPIIQVCADHGCCTGTFLNDTTLITAGHCIGHNREGDPHLRIGKTSALRIFENPTALTMRHQGMGWEGLTLYDAAIAVFEPGTAAKLGITSYLKIAQKAPMPGDKVTLVGYGTNDLVSRKGSGVKRWGTNRLEYVGGELSFLGFSIPGTGADGDAAGLPGDSGSPLLNDSREILGIASRITYQAGETRCRIYYSNIKNHDHGTLFRNAIRCDFGTLCARNFENSGVAIDEPPVPKPKKVVPRVCLKATDEARLAELSRAKKTAALSEEDDETLTGLISRAKNYGSCDGTPLKVGVRCLAPRELVEMYHLLQLEYEEQLGEEERKPLEDFSDRFKEFGPC